MIKLEWPNWLRRTGFLPVSMAVQILPPVFSTWLLPGLQGVLRKVLDVRTGLLKNSENLSSLNSGEMFETKVFCEICRGENSSLNRLVNLEVSLGCKDSISAIL